MNMNFFKFFKKKKLEPEPEIGFIIPKPKYQPDDIVEYKSFYDSKKLGRIGLITLNFNWKQYEQPKIEYNYRMVASGETVKDIDITELVKRK